MVIQGNGHAPAHRLCLVLSTAWLKNVQSRDDIIYLMSESFEHTLPHYIVAPQGWSSKYAESIWNPQADADWSRLPC